MTEQERKELIRRLRTRQQEDRERHERLSRETDRVIAELTFLKDLLERAR